MEDSVVLLCGYFRYVGSGAGSSVPAGSHAWDVEHSLSDAQLKKMLGAVRTAAAFQAGTTGSFLDTGIPRLNQGGALDHQEAEGRCPACVLL